MDSRFGRHRARTSQKAHAVPITDAAALLSDGTTLLRAGKAAKALPLLERARRALAESMSAAMNLEGAYIIAGRHRDAVPLLEWAGEREPDNSMVWLNLGAAYLGNPVLATGEMQERALAAFRRALEIDRCANHAHYNIGLIERDRCHWAHASAHFRAALETDPSDQDAATMLKENEAKMVEDILPSAGDQAGADGG